MGRLLTFNFKYFVCIQPNPVKYGLIYHKMHSFEVAIEYSYFTINSLCLLELLFTLLQHIEIALAVS